MFVLLPLCKTQPVSNGTSLSVGYCFTGPITVYSITFSNIIINFAYKERYINTKINSFRQKSYYLE